LLASSEVALKRHFGSKLGLRAQTVEIAGLQLYQDLLAKNVLITAQRNFCLSNSLLTLKIFPGKPFILLTSPVVMINLLKQTRAY